MRPVAITSQSLRPHDARAALPIGIRLDLLRTLPVIPYTGRCAMKTTGLSS